MLTRLCVAEAETDGGRWETDGDRQTDGDRDRCEKMRCYAAKLKQRKPPSLHTANSKAPMTTIPAHCTIRDAENYNLLVPTLRTQAQESTLCAADAVPCCMPFSA
eukprot:3792328-Rhodomonas_salina.1